MGSQDGESRLSIGLLLLGLLVVLGALYQGEPLHKRLMDRRPKRGSRKSRKSSSVQKTASNVMTDITKNGRACGNKRRI